MKAILRSDFYRIRSFAKTWLAVLAMLLVLGVMNNNLFFFSFYPTFFALMLPFTLASLDETSMWQNHLLSMPLTRGRLIAGRYVTIAVFITLMSLVSFIAMLIFPSEGLADCIQITLVYATAGFALAAVILPIIYKLGAQKARYAILPLVLIPMLISFLLPEGAFVWTPPAFLLTRWFPLVALAGALLLFVLSGRLSAALISKRNF